MTRVIGYQGDAGPAGHVAQLSDGRIVLVPSQHCLSIGDEYVEEIHGFGTGGAILAETEAEIVPPAADFQGEGASTQIELGVAADGPLLEP